MSRRLWPAALAALSILVLGSFLVYTRYITQRIQHDTAVTAQIYAHVYRGLLQIPLNTLLDPDSAGAAIDLAGTQPVDEDDSGSALIPRAPGVNTSGDAALLALTDIRDALRELDVPIVVFNAAGKVYSVQNLPFAEPDLYSEGGQKAALEYAVKMAAMRPAQQIVVPGVGEVIFGDPPLLAQLRWVPYLQVGTGVMLIVIAFSFMRADLRAHREKLWSAMARELAHQMGTPLSSLAGWIEVLQLPARERDQMAAADHIGRVMQADVERLERVSRRFELIGKAQAEQTVAIGDVIHELTGYFRPRLPHLARGVTLRTRVARGLPAIQANQVLLVWALENIIKNAVDALAGRGGRITIVATEARAQKHGRHAVQIVIADNGPGIAASVLERIFEPGVTTKSSGWGVGLSLSRRIIEELHGGRISAENRQGGGTAFTVSLPVARA